ncbi:MAG: SufD family Fe-S cluster assembly protein [Patescibacteria group bacterium]
MSSTLTLIPLEQSEDTLTSTVCADEKSYILLYGFCEGRKMIRVNLAQEGAYACIVGMIFGQRGLCSISTFQHHSASYTTSDLLIKTVLVDSAVFQYDGRIRIEQNAHGSNAYQRNENISLSPLTRIATRPSLEILANDVCCTHGATIGTFDDEDYFYLQSRGMIKSEAGRLLVRGFFQNVIRKIPAELMTDYVHTILERQLCMIPYE